MSDDILPPVPPGEKVVAERKGFFSSFFKKKQSEPFEHEAESPVNHEVLKTITIPRAEPAPMQTHEEEHRIGEVDIDRIRHQLGLDKAGEEVPEPPAIPAEDRQALEMEIHSTPPAPEAAPKLDEKLTMPKHAVSHEERIDFTKDSDDELDEPPLMDSGPAIAAKQPATSEQSVTSDWTSEVTHEPDKIASGRNSDFTTDLPTLDDLPTAETPETKMTEQPDLEVKSEPHAPRPEVDKPVQKGKLAALPDLEELELPAPKEEKQLGGPRVDKLARAKPEDNVTAKNPVTIPKEEHAERHKEISKEAREKMREQIRKEEQARIEKETQKERDKLKKERQAFEQDKIAVAGRSNKCDFKEKQLVQDRQALDEERRKFAAERKDLDLDKQEFAKAEQQLRKDKQDAKELTAKLPELKKEAERLQAQIQKISDKIKLNEQLEENLRKREEALKEAEKNLQETEQRIREEGFSDYLEAEAKGHKLISPKFTETKHLKDENRDIYLMVDRCKSLLWKEKVADAQGMYMKIRDLYQKVDDQEPEKEMLYTIIRELYDDIHLASMKAKQ